MVTHIEKINKLTEQIIGCAYIVHNNLGYGFLEKVYENALAHELKKIGLFVETQKEIVVMYDGIIVGEYKVDILVENLIPVELKAIKELSEPHTAQSINYLKASQLECCLLLNFGLKVQVKRYVNNLK